MVVVMGLVSEACWRNWQRLQITLTKKFTMTLQNIPFVSVCYFCSLFFFDDNIITCDVVISLLLLYSNWYRYSRIEKTCLRMSNPICIAMKFLRRIFLFVIDLCPYERETKKVHDKKKKVKPPQKSVKSFYSNELLNGLLTHTKTGFIWRNLFAHIFASLFLPLSFSFSDFFLFGSTLDSQYVKKGIFSLMWAKKFPFRFHINFSPRPNKFI